MGPGSTHLSGCVAVRCRGVSDVHEVVPQRRLLRSGRLGTAARRSPCMYYASGATPATTLVAAPKSTEFSASAHPASALSMWTGACTQAACKGVRPSRFRAFGSALCRSSRWTQPAAPRLAASSNADRPNGSHALTSTSLDFSSRASSCERASPADAASGSSCKSPYKYAKIHYYASMACARRVV